jgi:hypothetical protein
VIFISALSFVSIKFKFSFKVASYIMLGIAVCSELLKIFTHIESAEEGRGYLEPTALPLHLCSILIFVIFYITLAKEGPMKERLKSFFTPISLAGGTLAILMATSGVDFAKSFAYQCFIYHAGIIWFAIYLIATKQVSLGIKAYKSNLIILGSLVFIMLWVNSILSVYETIFFFLVEPPADNLPLLNMNNGWYAYFATVIILGIVLLTSVHLPAIIKESKKK